MSGTVTQVRTGADALLVADDTKDDIEQAIRDLLSRLEGSERSAVVLCNNKKEPYAVMMKPRHYDLLDAIVSIAVKASSDGALQFEEEEINEEAFMDHDELLRRLGEGS